MTIDLAKKTMNEVSPLFSSRRRIEYVLGYGDYLIGQDPRCDIWLPDPTASRKHARLSFDATGARVVDLESTNGTFLQNKRIKNAHELTVGTLKIGRCRVIVDVDERERSDNTTRGRLRMAVLPPKHTLGDPFGDTLEISFLHTPLESDDSNVEGSAVSARTTLDRPRSGTQPKAAQAIARARSGAHKALSVGDSVEFGFEQGSKRALYLTAISGRGAVYFFGDERYSKKTALCLTAERLSQRLWEGSARILRKQAS